MLVTDVEKSRDTLLCHFSTTLVIFPSRSSIPLIFCIQNMGHKFNLHTQCHCGTTSRSVSPQATNGLAHDFRAQESSPRQIHLYHSNSCCHSTGNLYTSYYPALPPKLKIPLHTLPSNRQILTNNSITTSGPTRMPHLPVPLRQRENQTFRCKIEGIRLYQIRCYD